jgi:glycogen(starch) synthase
MKILFHSWEYGTGSGGIAQYMHQMATGLGDHGHRAFVVAGRREGFPEVEETAYGRVYRMYDRSDVRSPWLTERVLELAVKHQVDVIEGADHWGECAGIIQRASRPPVLIKYHGCQIVNALTSAEVVYPWQRLTVGIALMRIRSQRHAERICVERADMVQAPSQKIVDDFTEQGTPLPEKLEIVPNMLARCPKPSSGVHEEASRPTLLYAGRLELRKGLQYLPGIVREVRRKFPDVLELAGNDCYARGLGSLREWLRRQFVGMEDNVRFLGGLDGAALDAAYRRSAMLVFPTKWDNFPMSVLESMGYAKPVVTTRNGGMPEMLKGTGAVIADADNDEFSRGICNFLADSDLRTRVGKACRERVLSHYMTDQVVEQYIRFLEKHL